MWEWLRLLTGAQASFVGSVTAFAFGLVALIFGALFNSHLNRRRDDRQRALEAKAVVAALYGEILLLRREVAHIARLVGRAYLAERLGTSRTLQFDEHFLERNTLADPVIYNASASKIGLLTPGLILAITAFHANYREVRSWLPRLVENEARGYSYSVLVVLKPAAAAVEDINPALRTIEQELRIMPADDPEMGEAPHVLDMEEQEFAQNAQR